MIHDIDNDDEPVGRVLTRRDILALFGAAGVAMITGCAQADAGTTTDPTVNTSTGACVVRPALTEGPYFVDEKLNRSDIRSDPSDGTVRPGALLDLTFNVSRVSGSTCAALAGVLVDVWHCDHLGVYSDATDAGFNTRGKKFLRGYQVTDANGVARFATIYPGWYAGRAVHIHFKIRSASTSGAGFEFTSQLFFNETLTDTVHSQSPYSVKGLGRTRNTQDGIYNGGGAQLILPAAASGSGYAGALDIALQV